MLETLLTEFENKEPEIVFEWNDSKTDARGWVIINSLRGGAAGGGTRMRSGLDKHEVVSLAKSMEIKFAVCGPDIGGAKAGIDFDPSDPRKKDVLVRWYQHVIPLLNTYWGTGGDLNVDQLGEVIPITTKHGLPHPQVGILRGHFQPTPSEEVARLGQLQSGVSKIIEHEEYSPELDREHTVSAMATGYGVAESARIFEELNGNSMVGKRVIIQGFGTVAGATAFYLSKCGAKIVGIIDIDSGIIDSDGLDVHQIKELLHNRDGSKLNSPKAKTSAEINEKIWDEPCDVFVPAAASRLVTQEHADRLINAGCSLFTSGANVPFADKEIFFGPIGRACDERISVIPGFIGSSAMARVYAYCMQEDAEITDHGIFNDISSNMERILKVTLDRAGGRTNVTRSAYELALEKLLK